MNRGMILLAEDNADDEALVLRSLRKNNIANPVFVARDGVEALDFIFSTGPHDDEPLPEIAVAMLDIKMPRVNGLEVLERIRDDPRTKRTPVVILTSSDEDVDLMRSYDLGVNSYVQKPVDFTEFSTAVTDMGLYWLLLNKAPPGRAATGG